MFLFFTPVLFAQQDEWYVKRADSMVHAIQQKTLQDSENTFAELTFSSGYEAAGVASAYTYKNEVVLVKRHLQIPYGVLETHYYYRHKEVFFIEEIESTAPANEEGEPTTKKYEENYRGKYYIRNREIIYQVSEGEKRYADEMPFNLPLELMMAGMYAHTPLPD